MRRWSGIRSGFFGRTLAGLALYALLLQAFLVGASPAQAFDPAATPLCSEMADGSGHSPAAPGGHGEKCLCIAACATSHAQAFHAGGTAPDIAAPETATAVLAPGSKGDVAHSNDIYRPGARAPPRS